MSAIGRAFALLTVLALAACASPRPATPPPATGAVPLPTSELVAAVQRDADRIDHSQNAAERTQLLTTATASAQQCLAQAPDDGACHYVQAQVLGLQARERPLQAASLLKEMLTHLTRAEALDPGFDHAGPARLSAVVLLRAPGWPLGPGDPDAAVAAAQRAVARDPGYPPNLITLAQAQGKTDATDQSRATFEQARLAIQAWTAAPTAITTDPAQWQRDVEQGLHDLQ
jgi:tetratricopeptide (TPR) repeat protein